MKHLKIFCLVAGVSFTTLLFSQDSIAVSIKNPVDSKELLQLMQFEKIGYFNVLVEGTSLKSKRFRLISTEYWDKKLEKKDTLFESRLFGMAVKDSIFELRLMTKKTSSDSVKFQFFLANLSIDEVFRTTHSHEYSLRNISNSRTVKHPIGQKITLFVYSLPYKDPDKPGYSFYCELSREGIPPEQWGEKFGVEHYIVFEIEFD
ncbi:MAG: hypothetical protein ACKV1O_10895 [Saprospiraceae bacterium]